MITASVPMWSHHEFIGVATVDVALSSINEFFRTALSGQRGYVFALDQQNRMLSYPELQQNIAADEATRELFQPFSEFSQQHSAFEPLQQAIEKIDAEFIAQANIDSAYTPEQLSSVTAKVPEQERAKLTALINQNAKSN